MWKRYQDIAVFVGLCLIILWSGLGGSRLWDQDEGYYASVAREMNSRGDWLVPTFNQELFAHKPPLMYWGMLAGFKLFGVSEFSARFASAVFGTGMVLLTYWLGRMLFGRMTGWIGALVLLSSVMFTVVARSATADAHLGFFVLLAITLWVDQARKSQNESLPVIHSWRWFWIYSAIAGGVLAKGPIGFAFPVAILGVMTLLWGPPHTSTTGSWLSWTQQCWQRFWIAFWSMRPVFGGMVLLGLAGPWFLWMQWTTGGAFLSEFFGVHHFERFSQPMDNHSGPIYYYVVSCLIGFFPWTSFAIPIGLHYLDRQRWQQDRMAMRLLTVWICFYFGVFSIASTKLPNYVIPVYPAVAISIAIYLSRWGQSLVVAKEQATAFQAYSATRNWALAGWLFMLGSGALLLGVPVLLQQSMQFQNWLTLRLSVNRALFPAIGTLSLMGGVLVVGAFAGVVLVVREEFKRMVWLLSGISCCFVLVLWQRVVPAIDSFQTPQQIALECLDGGDGSTLDRKHEPVVLGMFRPSMVFYSRRTLEFSPRENLLAVLNARQPEVVVVQDPDEDQVDALLTHGYRESRRYRSFPKKGWTSVYRTDWVEQATLQERAEGMRQAERIRDRLGEVGFETDCQSSSHEQTNNEPIEFAAWDSRGPS
jgi:4-amino-4-deoxy-L-arabinose transferase-like glycosyltransferase